MTLNKVLTIQNIAIAAVTFTASSIFGQVILTQEAAARCYGPAMPVASVCQLVNAPHVDSSLEARQAVLEGIQAAQLIDQQLG